MDQARDATDKLYLQIYRRLVSLIVSGQWPPHHRLPSSRTLAKDLAVSRTTTALAIDRLVSDGWAYSAPRKGVFVATTSPRPATGLTIERASTMTPIPLELSQGAVDQFPLARWTKAQHRIWSTQMPDGLYEPDPQGDPRLRARLASMVLIERGIQCSPDQIFIVASTRHALSLVARALATSCDGALVENPGFPSGRLALQEGGLATIPIPVDRCGVVTAHLGNGDGRRLLYLTPAAQFPTGATLANDRRVAIERWVTDGGNFLFEDDYDWEHRVDGRPPPPAISAGPAANRCFYSWSFSRLLFPSLRLAMLIVPDAWREAIVHVRSRIDGVVTIPNQMVLAEFIANGDFAAHRRHLRKICAARRSALLRQVEPYLGRLFDSHVNEAGLRLTLRAPPSIAASCAAALRERGILCSTLSDLASGEIAEDGIVLGFAAFPEPLIEQCGTTIAEAFEAVLQE